MPASIPVDVDRQTMIAMSAVRPVPARVKLADGTSKLDPNGTQAMHRISHLPLWAVDVVIPGDALDETARAGVSAVKIASATRPDVAMGQPVRFVDLAAMPYVDQDTKRVAVSYSANGVAPAAAGGRPQRDAA